MNRNKNPVRLPPINEINSVGIITSRCIYKKTPHCWGVFAAHAASAIGSAFVFTTVV